MEALSRQDHQNVRKYHEKHEAYNVTSVIPSSWSWYEHFQNILGGTTKMNSAIGDIDQAVHLIQLQVVSLDDFFEIILETQQH